MNNINNSSLVPVIDPGLKDEYIDEFINNCKQLLTNIERVLGVCSVEMKSLKCRAWYTNMEDLEISVNELSNYIQKDLDGFEHTLMQCDQFRERANKMLLENEKQEIKV